jgi:plasmid stabilization system protein ParE
LIVTRAAAIGLARCSKFLGERSPEAAQRAAQIITDRLSVLKDRPAIGRPVGTELEFRELVISFGESGYVALYRYEPDGDTVYVLAFRHQREAGY